MCIKDILLILNAEEPRHPGVELAMRLAQQRQAEVLGLCQYDAPALSIAEGYAIGAQAVMDVVADYVHKVRDVTDPAAAIFYRTAADHGCHARWTLCPPPSSGELVVSQAQAADLVVVCRPESFDIDQRECFETALIEAGAPCLLVPASAKPAAPFRRVVLAWNGSPHAKRAMDAALDLLDDAGAVELLVIDQKAGVLDADDALANLADHLVRHGLQASVRQECAKGREVGEIILTRCQAFAADLLVMGGYSHWRAAEAVLGGTTRSAPSNCSIPILMRH